MSKQRLYVIDNNITKFWNGLIWTRDEFSMNFISYSTYL
jgi:hypothetical protein